MSHKKERKKEERKDASKRRAGRWVFWGLVRWVVGWLDGGFHGRREEMEEVGEV